MKIVREYRNTIAFRPQIVKSSRIEISPKKPCQLEFGGKRKRTLRFDEKNHELKVQKLLEIDEKIQALHFDEKISEKRTQYVVKVK